VAPRHLAHTASVASARQRHSLRTLVRSPTRADSLARRAAACSAVSPGRSGDEVWDILPLLLDAATTAQRLGRAHALRLELRTRAAAGARPDAGRAAAAGVQVGLRAESMDAIARRGGATPGGLGQGQRGVGLGGGQGECAEAGRWRYNIYYVGRLSFAVTLPKAWEPRQQPPSIPSNSPCGCSARAARHRLATR
jgi:hypothetical protein